MKCNNCGAELAEGTKFCGSCGTAVQLPAEPAVIEPEHIETPAAETTEVQEKPKKASALAVIGAKIKPLTDKAKPIVEKCKPFVLKNKLWFAGGACLLILLITALIIVGVCTSGNGFTAVEHQITAEVTADNEVIIYFDNKKVTNTGIEATEINDEQRSIDGNIYAFLTITKDKDNNITDRKLILVKNKKATVVAEDVVAFKLSVNGKGIGYVTEQEAEGNEVNHELFLYNVSKKKSTSIQSEYMDSSYNYALSPDGKSMAYYKVDEDDGTYTLMYFNGSKHTKITSNEVTLIGLSNKGKYIYVTSTDTDEEKEETKTTLYCYNTKGDKQKLGSCSTSTFRFNEDHTQILYYDGAKSMISAKGKESVRISSNYVYPMIPKSSSSVTYSVTTSAVLSFIEYLKQYDINLDDLAENEYLKNMYEAMYKSFKENSKVYTTVVTVPCDNLYNKVYTCYKDEQYSAWLIKKNTDKSVRLVNNIGDCTMDESYEYLYYTDKDSNLMMIKVSHGERASDKAKQIAEDVDNYVVTSDRAKVYFISDDALYSCNGKTGKSKKTVAAEDVYSGIVLNANDVCFYIVEGDAYATSNGKKGKMVVADVGYYEYEYSDNIYYYMYVSENGVVYIETEDATFASKTNKKPSKIYTND